MMRRHCGISFFFFNDTATTEIYTLSLHDALPILRGSSSGMPASTLPTRSPPTSAPLVKMPPPRRAKIEISDADRKSTRLNSSHSQISYAVFCLKKKKDCDDVTYMEHTLRR